VSPRTAFGQYGRTNSSLTVEVTQPACLYPDGANFLEPRASNKKATDGFFYTWWRCSCFLSVLVPGLVVAATPPELFSCFMLVRCNYNLSAFLVVSSK